MKRLLQLSLLLAFCNGYLFSQDQSRQEVGNYDYQIDTALIDDRPVNFYFTPGKLKSDVALIENQQLLHYSKDYNFDLSSIDFSPPKLMLQKRTNLNTIWMRCGTLEDGLYRNYDSKSIILGTGIDYLFNDLIIRQLLNRKSFLRKH